MRVDVLCLDGVLDSALAVTRDVLAAANRIAELSGAPPPFRWRCVGLAERIRTGTGLAIQLDGRPGRADALVVLGMNVPLADELERALGRADVQAALPAVRRAARKLLLASCSGTFVCAEAGVLDGRDATTSWWLAGHFRARYPRVGLREDAMLVDSSPVVTAGAALSQLDLMLWLVRHVAGPELARLCARYLVIDERPSQGRYCLTDHLQHADERVARADAHARRHLGRITVPELARAAGVSGRTLERLFHAALGLTPVAYLQRLRAERAQHLLETTSLSVEAVAEKVGYADTVSLRRVLRRNLGVGARQLRRVS